MFAVKLVAMPLDLGRIQSRLLWHERYRKDPAPIWLRSMMERVVRSRAR